MDAPILSRIPSDYMTAVSALNLGQPFVLSQPKCRLSLAVGDIAALLENGAEHFDLQQLPSKERNKLLRRYRGRDRAERQPLLARKKK